jgi:RNA polymerase sigma-70 factor (ECF subfamily)
VDDSALLKRAWTGSEEAFSELFSRYQRRIFQYATRMCGPAVGDDVVQETFLAVLRPGSFDDAKGTVVGYLFGIARHHVARHLTKHGTSLDDGAALPGITEVATRELSAFDVLVREQSVSALRAAVDALPPPYREVVVLCDLQEMDYKTVSGILECPLGTVRSRLHRARALLAETLRQTASIDERVRKHG